MSGEPERPPQAASSGREPTDDPDRFLIPSAELPSGFADQVEKPVGAVAEAIPASTVVLVRSGARGPEVLLLRRPARSSFAAGAWVFPGGRVDESDRDTSIVGFWDGPPAGDWRRRLDVEAESEAIAYVAAAIREAWEETGIVLSSGHGGSAAGLARARQEILQNTLSLREAAERERVRLDTSDLLYIAHWITPEAEPRRFDTRFFLGRVEPDTACDLYGDELVESMWLTPSDAVNRNAESELKMLPPTLHTLRRLAGYTSLDEMWISLRNQPIPCIVPVMRRDPRGIIIDISP